MKKIKNPTKKDRILVLAPHPDDEALACFGYLSRAVKNKAKIRIVVLTHGYFTAKPEIRYKESLTTLSQAGIDKKDVYFLGFRDTKLRKISFCSDVIKKIISSFKPTIIFCPSVYDFNTDHRATYYNLKKAIEKNSKIKIYYYLIHYNKPIYLLPTGLKQNYFLYPPTNLIFNNDIEWFKLELKEKEVKTKHEAIMNYKSQLRMFLFKSRRTLLSFIRRNELFYCEKINN